MILLLTLLSATPAESVPRLVAVAKPVLRPDHWVRMFEDTYDWVSDHEIAYAQEGTPGPGMYAWKVRVADLKSGNTRNLSKLSRVLAQSHDSGGGITANASGDRLLWFDSLGNPSVATLDGKEAAHFEGYFLSSNGFFARDGKGLFLFDSKVSGGAITRLRRYDLGARPGAHSDWTIGRRLASMFKRDRTDVIYEYRTSIVGTEDGFVFAGWPQPSSTSTNKIFLFELARDGGQVELKDWHYAKLDPGWECYRFIFKPGGAKLIAVTVRGWIDRSDVDSDEEFEVATRTGIVSCRLVLYDRVSLRSKVLGEVRYKQTFPPPIDSIRWIPGQDAISFRYGREIWRMNTK